MLIFWMCRARDLCSRQAIWQAERRALSCSDEVMEKCRLCLGTNAFQVADETQITERVLGLVDHVLVANHVWHVLSSYLCYMGICDFPVLGKRLSIVPAIVVVLLGLGGVQILLNVTIVGDAGSLGMDQVRPRPPLHTKARPFQVFSSPGLKRERSRWQKVQPQVNLGSGTGSPLSSVAIPADIAQTIHVRIAVGAAAGS